MPTVAQLSAVFTADIADLDRGGRRATAILEGVGRAAETAEEYVLSFSRSLRELIPSFDRASAAAEGFSRQGRSAARVLASMTTALERLGITARGSLGSLADLGDVAGVITSTVGGLRAEIVSLNRTMGSQAAANYAERLETTGNAASAADARVEILTRHVAALNQEMRDYRSMTARSPSALPALGSAGGGRVTASSLASRAVSVGKAMTSYITTPVLAAGAAAEFVGVKFETAMAKIEALAGVSKKQVDEWGGAILRIGPKLGQMPEELAKAMFYIASEGFRGKEALDILATAGKQSAIGMGDAASNAKALVFALHDYAAMNLTAAQASDVLTATVRVGNVDTEKLVSNLGKVLPVASRMGISFAQIGGAFAALTREGLPAAQAATAIAGVLRTFDHPSAATKKGLDGIRLSAAEMRREMQDNLLGAMIHIRDAANGNSEAFAKVFPNARGYIGALGILSGKLSDARDAFGQVSNSAGVTNKAFATVSNTTQQQLNRALASLESAGIRLATSLAPIVREVAQDVGQAADAFGKLDPQVQKSIVQAALYAAALGPVLSVCGNVYKSVELLRNGLLLLAGTSTTVAAGAATTVAAETAVGTAATAAAARVGLLRAALMAVTAHPFVITIAAAGAGAYAAGKFFGDGFEKDAAAARSEVDRTFAANYQEQVKRTREAYAKNGVAGTNQLLARFQTTQHIVDQVVGQIQANKAYDEGERRRYSQSGPIPHAPGPNLGATDTAPDYTNYGLKDSDAGGGKKKKADDTLQQYRDSQYELARTIALQAQGTEDSKAAALAYDIAHRHLDGYTEAISAGNTHLSRQILTMATANLGLTRHSEAYKKAKENADEYAESVKKAVKSAHDAAIDLAKSRSTDDRDTIALETQRVPFSQVKDPRIRAAIEAQGKAVKDLQASKADNSGFGGTLQSNLKEALEASAQRKADQIHDAVQWDEDLKDFKARLDDGSESAAKRAKSFLDNYAHSIRSLVKEMQGYKKETDAARVAEVQFDEEGQRMTLSQAQAVVSLQKYVGELRKWKEQVDRVAEAGANVAANSIQHVFEHGFKGLFKSTLQDVRQTVQQILLEIANAKIRAGIEGVFQGTKPHQKTAPGAVQAAYQAAMGGAQGASPVPANTSALNLLKTSVTGLKGSIDDLIELWGGVPGEGSDTPGLGQVGSLLGGAGGGNFMNVLTGLSFLPGFATGGDTGYGSPVIVGEHGPEIIMPRHSSTVIPNGGTTTNMRAGDEFHIHMHFGASGEAADRRSDEQRGAAAFRGFRAAHARHGGR